MGDYLRTTVYLNLNVNTAADVGGGRFAHGLPGTYSLKAVSLKGVARDHVVYGPTDLSRVERFGGAGESVDPRQSPVVFAKVGDGWLGYVGDVNGEVESTAVIVAMCGLGG